MELLVLVGLVVLLLLYAASKKSSAPKDELDQALADAHAQETEDSHLFKVSSPVPSKGLAGITTKGRELHWPASLSSVVTGERFWVTNWREYDLYEEKLIRSGTGSFNVIFCTDVRDTAISAVGYYNRIKSYDYIARRY